MDSLVLHRQRNHRRVIVHVLLQTRRCLLLAGLGERRAHLGDRLCVAFLGARQRILQIGLEPRDRCAHPRLDVLEVEIGLGRLGGQLHGDRLILLQQGGHVLGHDLLIGQILMPQLQRRLSRTPRLALTGVEHRHGRVGAARKD